MGAYAQKPSFGFSMGANFSNLIGPDKIEDSKVRIGMCPGMMIDIPLAYDAFLEIGAFYSQQGVTIKQNEVIRSTTRMNYKTTKFVDYAILPIYWKQSFGDIYTKLGPYVATPIKASSKWSQELNYRDSLETSKGTYSSFVNKLRPYDVGASLAVGFQTSVSHGIDLFLDLSYKTGFFSIEQRTDTQKKVMRNQFFTVGCGIMFVQSRKSKTYRRR